MKNNEVKTSFGNIKKVPTGLKKMLEMKYDEVINWGCGKGYKFHAEKLEGQIKLINFDPFIEEVSNEPIATKNTKAIVCNNVLNVIEDDDVMISVVLKMMTYGLPIHITIYEGDADGIGKHRKGGTYQRNMKTKDYKFLEGFGFKLKNKMWTRAGL